MLIPLRQIVQEVNSAANLQQALAVIVARVKAEMKTEVCSVYLRDPVKHDYVLMATDGLNLQAVGNVRISPDKGLVGWVVTRAELINLDQADKHPRYLYFPETGEERYSSFMGVPIIHQGDVRGVLVLQQHASRRFDEAEESFLITLSAQLAGVIAHAEATGSIDNIVLRGVHAREVSFRGVSGATGVAVGHGVVISAAGDLRAVPYRECEDVEQELAHFAESLQKVRADLERIGEKLATQVNQEERALFDAYLHMLSDHALGGEIAARIREQKLDARTAVSQVVTAHINTFEAMEDEYLRERASDVRDLGVRVLEALEEGEKGEREFPDRFILVGDELTASMLGEIPLEKLAGMVSVKGSGNSHISILARALGIPTVMALADLPYAKLEGREIIVDGYYGRVTINPSDELRRQYRQIEREDLEQNRELEALRDLPSQTTDGHAVQLWVNTGLMADITRSQTSGAQGVGLFRTEVPFLLLERFPSEEEQREIYRKHLEAFAPRPVTMRTLDIGGDKPLPYFPIKEENPFLGWRGIRISLDHPEIFLVQIRAMLKASEGLNNLRIMFPMITNVSELDQALGLVARAYHELIEEGFAIRMPSLGVMVEVPAAIFQVRELARRVDFISIGSNDLMQYMLAVDRNNARVANLYHLYHPAVLRALQRAVEDCHSQGRPISICGEMAGEPGAAILLTAMGFDIISTNAFSLPKVKDAIRKVSLMQARRLLNEVLPMERPEDILAHVEASLAEFGMTVRTNAR